MSIEPDTKNWTWVLDRPCAECGFDASTTAYDSIPDLLRDNAKSWSVVLARSDVRERPDESTWSALEYAAHVRDANGIFRDRLALMLAQDDPPFANWDQDATAVEGRYNDLDPAVVGRELVSSTDALADAFAAVPADLRTRSGRRSDGSSFTVESLARYFVHDPIHHLFDVSG
ncbi:DinB family protein [Antrihabitans cavernicola]|uniref:DinB family protein n=1 Tax=Antrihabitans cavernicola TaxID=2495913 RepID=A0A5A7SER8_9NOCA|nr:DinB family protein [Spelaeibacter cavernicola]KAA0023025.1 DinB family protein [Spelaeibacter cavernicola]